MTHHDQKVVSAPSMALGLVALALAFQLGSGDAKGEENPPANSNPIQERGVPVLPPAHLQTGSLCTIKLGPGSDRIVRGPDLCISALTLSQTRHVTFTVRNVGGHNTGIPFSVDVYLNNVKTDSIPMPDMGSQSDLSIEAGHAFLPTCQPALVRVVLDPQGAVHEANRSDNDYMVNWPLPCPDVTAEISQDKVNHDLQYYAHIKVMNHGGMVMPALSVRTLGMTYNPTSPPPVVTSCIQNHNCDVKDGRMIGPLAPGQIVEYNVDPKFLAAQTLIVVTVIVCESPNNCLESNQTNNTISRVIGPH